MASPKTLTPTPRALKPYSEADQRLMGKQLTEQYERTQLAALEIVAFGAMCMEVETAICAELGTDAHIGGKNAKGQGFKGWLAQYAPDVGYSNARRYRDIAHELQGQLALKSADDLRKIANTAAKPRLDPKLMRKREQLVEMVADKSVLGLQRELGLVDAPERGGARKVETKRTPEEIRRDIAAAYARSLAPDEARYFGKLDLDQQESCMTWWPLMHGLNEDLVAKAPRWVALPPRERRNLADTLKELLGKLEPKG